MKKIDHAYQNFDADKFLNSLKEFESESLLNFVTDHIIPSIKNYNEANDENGFFEQYVKDLVSTGEFFEKLKKSFEIVFKFENRLKEGVWNTAYVLLFKKQKICLLLNFETVHSLADTEIIFLLDKFNYNEKEKLSFDHIKKKLYQNLKDIWTEVYKKKSWEDIYKTFISTEYNHVRSLKFNKKYYKEAHPEALELEHVEIN